MNLALKQKSCLPRTTSGKRGRVSGNGLWKERKKESKFVMVGVKEGEEAWSDEQGNKERKL